MYIPCVYSCNFNKEFMRNKLYLPYIEKIPLLAPIIFFMSYLYTHEKIRNIIREKIKRPLENAIKDFFYYINVILAKGQNNIIERVYGQREGRAPRLTWATRDGCLILSKEAILLPPLFREGR